MNVIAIALAFQFISGYDSHRSYPGIDYIGAIPLSGVTAIVASPETGKIYAERYVKGGYELYSINLRARQAKRISAGLHDLLVGTSTEGKALVEPIGVSSLPENPYLYPIPTSSIILSENGVTVTNVGETYVFDWHIGVQDSGVFGKIKLVSERGYPRSEVGSVFALDFENKTLIATEPYRDPELRFYSLMDWKVARTLPLQFANGDRFQSPQHLIFEGPTRLICLTFPDLTGLRRPGFYDYVDTGSTDWEVCTISTTSGLVTHLMSTPVPSGVRLPIAKVASDGTFAIVGASKIKLYRLSPTSR